MKRFKNALFLATVASSALASSFAQAQTPASNDGETAVHGTGASSIQGVLVQELNCNGSYSNLGVIGTSSTAGTSSTVVEPTNLPSPSGTFNCATTDLNTGFLGRYIASGSGAGRSAFINPGTLTTFTNSPFAIGTANPNPFGTWNRVQFAFGDSSVTDGDLTTYTGGAALTNGGAPIMFPKYVLPVALAYSPTYGHNDTTGSDYTFNIGFAQNILGNAAGGLRMSQATYCGVFNGTILNFNNASFTTDNGGTSLMDADDAAEAPGRWASDGVPVRLVGRLDRSGTTDIFTRALAAQCGSGASNKYKLNAETLPYNRSESATTRPTFGTVRADTGLQTSSTQPEAGLGGATLVGSEYFSGTAIVRPTENAGKAATSFPTGANGSGRFLVADGSGRVASAIKFAPDYASPTASNVKLNGKVGYIGADFIDGSPSAPGGLKAAALKGGSSASWYMPSAANATLAFGTILPPQSASDGTLNDSVADTRQVRIPTYQGGTGVPGNAARTNPLAWYDVIYSDPSSTLANPTNGYPIAGSTQYFGYTCYKVDANGSNARSIVNFLNFNTDYIATLDGAGATRTGIFTRTAATFANAGLLARSNIGALPDAWKHAVRQTFLTKSSETSSVNGTLGGYNLYVDDANGFRGAGTANTTCTSRAGI
ncbi:hypothetical protein E5A73_20640 [Sphingomonas gei]|uniref:PBP domain-containing protein n=1 Tax=Sphingomonas gei TaxID=1395960 RepID=A0A4S1X3C1_9SPHN|nr:hypothetical protein [Sphingomonas gei]TGX48716.1 hypothetical protein E5A73_20640 [Sphingomonas gei]